MDKALSHSFNTNSYSEEREQTQEAQQPSEALYVGLELTSAPRLETQLNHALSQYYDFVCTPLVRLSPHNNVRSCLVLVSCRCTRGFGAIC